MLINNAKKTTPLTSLSYADDVHTITVISGARFTVESQGVLYELLHEKGQENVRICDVILKLHARLKELDLMLDQSETIATQAMAKICHHRLQVSIEHLLEDFHAGLTEISRESCLQLISVNNTTPGSEMRRQFH